MHNLELVTVGNKTYLGEVEDLAPDSLAGGKIIIHKAIEWDALLIPIFDGRTGQANVVVSLSVSKVGRIFQSMPDVHVSGTFVRIPVSGYCEKDQRMIRETYTKIIAAPAPQVTESNGAPRLVVPGRLQ